MANTERDPVCGMDIDPENAAAQAQYQGKTYYFCAESCRNEFDANPQQFATD
ncbi:MAG: YHS domain-containing protein [Tepidiformaceae bacterium]